MALNLEQLLTLRPPSTVPLIGVGRAAGDGLALMSMETSPAKATHAWQLTLSRERGISVPFCVIFMPVPPADAASMPSSLPPHTVYSRWHAEDGTLTQRFRVPSSLWEGSEGLLVLLAHLHDDRLIESIDAPWSTLDDLRPVAEMRSSLLRDTFRLSPGATPDDATLQAVLTRKLRSALLAAQEHPPAHMVRPPGPQAIAAPIGVNIPAPRQSDRMPAGQQLCFIAASCAYQGGFVDRALPSPSWAAGPADASMQRLIDWRQDAAKPQPTLALLLGDQIYADATAGLFDPRSLDNRFVQPYLDAQQSRFLGEALSGIEVHTMIDDHEIDNNYSPISNRDQERFKENAQRFDNGLASYKKYQCFSVLGDPPTYGDALRHNEELLDDYFEKDGIPFLLVDTRTHRQQREATNIDTARLLTDTQWEAIRACLRQSSRDKPLFICTPSILLPRRLSTDEQAPASSLLSDAWDGYPAELYTLLALLHEEQANHVVFVSGDEHLSCIARFTISCESEESTGPDVRGCSIHSSPLYAPYPFANGLRAQLREYDDFRFHAPHAPAMRYRCISETTFAPPGDGFAVVQISATANGQEPIRTGTWRLEVAFSRASGVHVMSV